MYDRSVSRERCNTYKIPYRTGSQDWCTNDRYRDNDKYRRNDIHRDDDRHRRDGRRNDILNQKKLV